MFSLYHFKQHLITTYTKMFHFLFYHIDDNKEEFYMSIIGFSDLNVQLFTSDILAAYVLD